MAANWVSQHEPDHIRKCANDIQDLLLAKPSACHYHALNVLYNIKKQDMMSFVKMMLLVINKNSSYGILATIQLIRYCREVLEADLLDNNSERAIFMWLAKQLNKNNTIVIEVAKTLVSMKNVSNSDLLAAVSSLNIYLLSMNPINVFSALKIYNRLVDHPAKASLLTSTTDIESHLSNNNKAVKSLALSILLKVCREDKVSELLDKAYEIFTDLPDSVKVSVVAAAEEISRKYPEKTREVILFLWRCLRDRGELDFKVRAIKKITELMKKRAEYFDKVFDFFCEYIEDPYSPKLVHIILDVFVENIQHCSEPKKILRFVLNRLHLDEGKTRSAAISCLGEVGLKVTSIRSECLSIISSYSRDIDDEVRERANYYTGLLQQKRLQVDAYSSDVFSQDQLESIQAAIRNGLDRPDSLDLDKIVNAKAVERATGSLASSLGPQVPHATAAKSSSNKAAATSEFSPDLEFCAFAKSNEDLREYGPLLVSKPAIDLSHKDSDYYVQLTKHFFEEHIVLEYIVSNQDEQHVGRPHAGHLERHSQHLDRQRRPAGLPRDRKHAHRERLAGQGLRLAAEKPGPQDHQRRSQERPRVPGAAGRGRRGHQRVQ